MPANITYPGQLFKTEVCKIVWFIYVFSFLQVDETNVVLGAGGWGMQCRASVSAGESSAGDRAWDDCWTLQGPGL